MNSRAKRTVSTMIGYLEGVTKNGATIVVDKSGVGWAVSLSQTIGDDTEVQLWIQTIVRENDISLYGFLTETEKEVFKTLSKVTGVGPTTAITLLKDVGCAEIVSAIVDNTPAALCVARGVGIKLASKIIANTTFDPELIVRAGAVPAVEDPNRELVQAIVDLGYSKEQVHKVLESLLETEQDVDESDLIGKAIMMLVGATTNG